MTQNPINTAPPLRPDPLLWALLALLAAFCVSPRVWAQTASSSERPSSEHQTCPPGYKCLTDAQAEELSEIVANHNCMVDAARNGDLRMDLEEQRVVVTEQGQVLTDDKLKGTLRWCQWELDFEARNEVSVTKQMPSPEPKWGLRLRVKLGFVWLPSQIGTSFDQMFDPVLAFEPFYWRMLHVQTHAGFQQAGLSLGVDVTKNMDLFGGASVEYATGDLVPVFGLSLSFN